MKIPIPTEAAEQACLFEWAELMSNKYPCLHRMYAIPNGGSRHILEAVNLKKAGVKKGVPDIFLPTAQKGFHGLFIEMKRQKGSVESKEQKDYKEYLLAEGYQVKTCMSWFVARREIEEYLDIPIKSIW